MRKFLFWLLLLVLAACELVMAWRVPGFTDWYVAHIFPVFGATYGRLSGLFKFSVGELLIYGGVLFAVFTVIIWLVRFVKLCERKESLKKLSRGCTKVLLKLMVFIALVQVQNCFVLYHASPLYTGTVYESYESNRDDLIALREKLAIRANEMSEVFERNKKGEIVYDTDIKGIAKIAMQGLGEDARTRIEEGRPEALDEKLKLLSGYYSSPKPFFKSDFFSQQSIAGYYFPFSLEANYNDLMYIANIPDTMCHELSHLKGFIYEDEASFLAYLGCMNSKDNFFIYSATLNALSYVDFEVKKELALEPSIRESLTPISDKVIFDSAFLTDEAWEEVEKDAWFDTKKVSEASDTFLDTNLTLNGVEDGIVSYSRMVDLLLKYYYGGND